MAIQSSSNADTQELFTTGKCKRFAAIAAAAMRKLTQLDSAPTINFMKLPPGNDLKFYNEAWYVRINRQWRLTFKWGDTGPYDVLIDDPH